MNYWNCWVSWLEDDAGESLDFKACRYSFNASDTKRAVMGIANACKKDFIKALKLLAS